MKLIFYDVGADRGWDCHLEWISLNVNDICFHVKVAALHSTYWLLDNDVYHLVIIHRSY